MSEHRRAELGRKAPRPARLIRPLALPILLLWIAIAVLTNVVSPRSWRPSAKSGPWR